MISPTKRTNKHYSINSTLKFDPLLHWAPWEGRKEQNMHLTTENMLKQWKSLKITHSSIIYTVWRGVFASISPCLPASALIPLQGLKKEILCCTMQSTSPVPHIWRWLLIYWMAPFCIFAHTEYLPDFGKMDFINFPHSTKGIKENTSIRINKSKVVCLPSRYKFNFCI